MVDETAQLDLILDATADLLPRTGGRRIRVALELDVSYAPLPGIRFGAPRSARRARPPAWDVRCAPGPGSGWCA